MYMYIYIYIHTHTHTYIYMELSRCPGGSVVKNPPANAGATEMLD